MGACVGYMCGCVCVFVGVGVWEEREVEGGGYLNGITLLPTPEFYDPDANLTLIDVELERLVMTGFALKLSMV